MNVEPPGFQFLEFADLTQIISYLLILFLLFCSAVISGAEVAFFSLTEADFEANENPSVQRKLDIVRNLLDRPKKLLATILVSNNFINIAIVLLFGTVSETLFSGVSENLYGIPVRFILEVVLVTFFILLFGEILPKIYANRNRVSFSIYMAQPIKILDTVLSPVTLPMKSATTYLHGKLGKQKSNFNVSHLSQALELSNQDTTQEEQKILRGIVTFGNTEAKQVMKNRMDIFALNEETPFKEIMPEIIRHGYSRIPVYKDSIDHITGILYAKDLIPYTDRKQLDWPALAREPYFVPENKKLDDLLNDFKEMKTHLAIVVDEYGGTSGLISLEDIIEEIVGEISDEFDDEDLVFSKLDDKNYVFDGKTTLKDFYSIIGLEEPDLFEAEKGEAETIAGFLLEISKGFPKKNEVIQFHNYKFKIEAFEGKRIKQIKLTIEDLK